MSSILTATFRAIQNNIQCLDNNNQHLDDSQRMVLGKPNDPKSIKFGDASRGIINHGKEQTAENNAARNALITACKEQFNVKKFSQLPECVRKAFKVSAVKDDLKLQVNDQGVEQVTSGRPLTARRIQRVIAAVKQAISEMPDDKPLADPRSESEINDILNELPKDIRDPRKLRETKMTPELIDKMQTDPRGLIAPVVVSLPDEFVDCKNCLENLANGKSTDMESDFLPLSQEELNTIPLENREAVKAKRDQFFESKLKIFTDACTHRGMTMKIGDKSFPAGIENVEGIKSALNELFVKEGPDGKMVPDEISLRYFLAAFNHRLNKPDLGRKSLVREEKCMSFPIKYSYHSEDTKPATSEHTFEISRVDKGKYKISSLNVCKGIRLFSVYDTKGGEQEFKCTGDSNDNNMYAYSFECEFKCGESDGTKLSVEITHTEAPKALLWVDGSFETVEGVV